MPITDPMHPQPPSIESPQPGNAPQWRPGKESSRALDEDSMSDAQWLERARAAYQISTSYIDGNYRQKWSDSIRAFHNQHPTDSKFSQENYRKRSHLYRPKVRSVIRKNEAATAAAFFSNLDRLSITAQDQDDKQATATAEVIQRLIQYRLTTTLPWFHTILGGIQDTQVQGAAIAHCHWKYEQNQSEDIDRPEIDLIPIENFRFDPCASWTDPVNTSPYLIHLIPMYIGDVKARMRAHGVKQAAWRRISDAVLTQCRGDFDGTRQARRENEQDPTQTSNFTSDYDVVWIHRHIHRVEGDDYEFYTLASRYLLTTPRLLKSQVFHGRRPYVFGVFQLESHRPLPDSLPILTEGLSAQSNEVMNQRLDNVKLVLNKRWFAKRSGNVDIGSLVRNVPGSITLLDDVEHDVKQVDFQDVTQSSYIEQDRINSDFDDMVGNFSAASIQTQRTPREPARSMQLLQAPANLLTEYMLKTYSETFVAPVLRQLMLLEQYYETDMKLIALAGKSAQIMQRYGVESVTDYLIEKELNLTVNVGMGGTDMNAKLQKFVYAITSIGNLSHLLPAGLNFSELAKELFALTGYQDGARFFVDNDPDQAQNAMTENKKLMLIIKQLQMKLANKQVEVQSKLAIAHDKNQTAVAVEQIKQKHENARLLAEHVMGSIKDKNALLTPVTEHVRETG